MTYQADDRLDTFRQGSGSSQTLTHDTDGNLTHAPDLGTLSYNSRNQLIQHQTDTYQYDAAGRRVMTWRNGTAIRDLHDTRISAYTLLARETWAPGGTFADFRYFVYTPNGQLLYEVRLNAASTETDMRWYHFDSRGNTLALSNANGQQTDTFTYTPYGQHTQLSGQWQATFLYNGAHGIQTLPTGLLHMRNRDYSPQLKRFTTQDPIGFDGGWNLYAYAAGNPVVFGDPLGLATVGVGLTGGAAAGIQIGGDIMITLSVDTDNLSSLDSYRIGYLASWTPATAAETDITVSVGGKVLYTEANAPEEIDGGPAAFVRLGVGDAKGIDYSIEAGNLNSDDPKTVALAAEVTYSISPVDYSTGVQYSHGRSVTLNQVYRSIKTAANSIYDFFSGNNNSTKGCQ